MLEIRVLGELELRRSGRVIALPASKKARALLGFLAVTRREHRRETLCELLWPGPNDPRAELRWSLTKLRGLVDQSRTQRLVADRERVAFDDKDCSVDLLTVRGLVGADHGGVPADAPLEALKRAAELCRGEFLEGLDLDDCYRYHEWCVAEREAARSLRVEVLAALVQRLAASPEEALGYARARVAIDPLSESAHVEVIRLLGQLGKRREGLAQFETCRRILQVELGVRPSNELQLARSSLMPAQLADEAPPETIESPVAAAPSAALAPSTNLLVGRQFERTEIATRVADVARGLAQPMVLFVGEPGIGKTRLLEATVEAMVAAGGTVLRARAFEAERIRPYGPFIDALTELGTLADESLRRELAPLLPQLGPAAASDQTSLFDAVARLFTRAASRAPLCLCVDDVQWFDEASTALLHSLSRSLPSSVFIAGAARPAELGDNAPMQRLIHGLLREGRLVEYPVAQLARADVAQLIRAHGADEREADRVFDESGGHPYFAVELARALARGDRLIAPSLTAMIDDRIARLGPLARSVLPWAAALRRTIDSELLGRITQLAHHELFAALTELEEHRVLVPKVTGYDFAHDLLRAAVYRKLSEPRRRLIHGQIARALSDGGAALASDLAHHAALGGDRATAARASLEAGRQALRAFANPQAVVIARFGIEHAVALPTNERLRLHVDLLEILYASRTWRGQKDELAAEAMRVVAECEAAGLAEEAGQALHMLSSVDYESDTTDQAFDHSMRAVDVSKTTSPASRAARLAATGKCLTFLEREMGSARQMLDEADALTEECGSELLDLCWGRGLMLAFEGKAELGRAKLRRVIELARAGDDRFIEFLCSIDLAMVELDSGRAAEALVIVEQLAPLMHKIKEDSETAKVAALEALARLALGEPDAPAATERALVALRHVDAKAMLSCVQRELAVAELGAGRTESARALATSALSTATAVRRRTDQALARVVLARASLLDGRPEEALAELAPALADLQIPHGLSARARAEVEAVRTMLAAVPTLAPTFKTTVLD